MRTCRVKRSSLIPSFSATRSAQDDFGVKQIGLDWHGIDDPVVKSPAVGERILSAGGYDKDTLEIIGTFSAKSLGIEPQPISLRLFAEDYFPGRARVYSATYTFYVLTAEQHAHLDHRAIEQMAPPIAGSPRPRDAVVRNQQAIARADRRRAGPARHAPPHREPGNGRAG